MVQTNVLASGLARSCPWLQKPLFSWCTISKKQSSLKLPSASPLWLGEDTK